MTDHSDDRVVVPFFNRQPDGSEIVIGPSEQGSFLALPPDAVEILDDLAAGYTFGESRDRYEDRHGQVPDLEGLLGALEAEGFVRWRARAVAGSSEEPARPLRYHLAGFPESLAKGIFSIPTFVVGGILAFLATLAVIDAPSIVPGPSALFLSYRIGTSALLLAPLVGLAVAFHELSHLIAARARGVPARFGIGHRLWVLVVETDMSGIWALPRNKRYLPMLAGSITDGISASVLLLILAAENRQMLEISPVFLGVLRALLVVYFYQLVWQCFFFVRTDFYYAIANYFHCKNLMEDTSNFLRNQWARWTGRGKTTDQSGIPETEMAVVRKYSVVWVLGRALAITLLVTIQIPLFFHYFTLLVNSLSSSEIAPEVLVPVTFAILTFSAGLFLWIRSLRNSS